MKIKDFQVVEIRNRLRCDLQGRALFSVILEVKIGKKPKYRYRMAAISVPEGLAQKESVWDGETRFERWLSNPVKSYNYASSCVHEPEYWAEI